ncbi:uncharacterized protein LOC126844400 [Adelges cooleyi]|uniref:uncharacterized protein LOC126844400 n=1 Tax=Adelges cooleyi TaxID=133065 RepID=UPI00217FB83D|nr:uncharacterized protein LOC126844400 [Adelges cooleyi]
MNKILLPILVVAVAACSAVPNRDRRSDPTTVVAKIDSETEVKPNSQTISTAEVDTILQSGSDAEASSVSQTNKVDEDLKQTAETAIVAESGRGKKGKGKMEMMHMGLTYIKMLISTFMSAIGHFLQLKGVTIALLSFLFQVLQFIMTYKKSKESSPMVSPWVHHEPAQYEYQSPQQYRPPSGSGYNSGAYHSRR